MHPLQYAKKTTWYRNIRTFVCMSVRFRNLYLANCVVFRNQYCISTKTESSTKWKEVSKQLFATPKSTTTTLFLARKRIDFIQSCWLRHTTLPFHPSTYTMWGRKSEYRQSIKDDIGQIYRHDANAIPYILGRIYHLFSNLMIGEEAGE